MIASKLFTKALVGLAVLALPLLAHHEFSAHFDKDKPVTLTGIVQGVTWSEPHVMFTLNVPMDGAKGDWSLEAASPSTLKKQSFDQSNLKEGDPVTVHAYQALDGSMKASARSIEVQGGRAYVIGDKDDGGPAPEVETSHDRH
jgi:hypothetical protein